MMRDLPGGRGLTERNGLATGPCLDCAERTSAYTRCDTPAIRPKRTSLDDGGNVPDNVPSKGDGRGHFLHGQASWSDSDTHMYTFRAGAHRFVRYASSSTLPQ
jgi:hypothetical protein